MSREWVTDKRSDGWQMICDREGCGFIGGRGDLQDDLPLTRFVAEGWFIAHTHGDLCPACVEELGGMDSVTRVRRLSGPGAPHRFMSEIGAKP